MTSSVPSHPRAARRHRRVSIAAASVLLLAVGAAFASITPSTARALGLVPAAEAPQPAEAPQRAEVPQRAEASESLEQWLWPVPAPIRIVSPFRAPPTPYAPGHRGIDVAVEQGAVIVAPAAGIVSFAGRVVDRGVVAIDHGGGVVSAIEPVDALVAAGTAVAAGDPIGTAASGGHCAAECAHFGVRIDGEYVSPFLFLGGLQRAVLLPMP
jgi:murein DD-endopeptidase MepM/ murein hydrolase activator NlpD